MNECKPASRVGENPSPDRKPNCCEAGTRPHGIIRRGRYKLLLFYEDDRVELYDLESDLGEKHNLADRMPEKVVQLRRSPRLAHLGQRANARAQSSIRPRKGRQDLRLVAKSAHQITASLGAADK